MATLRVTRVFQYLGGRTYYPILVDGEYVKSLANSESVELNIDPGHQEVIVKLPGCESNAVSIEVEPEGIYHFRVTCGSTASPSRSPRRG